MRRQRATKIIATLGPASSTPEMIETLFLAGADLFRLNFSHGTHAAHEANIQAIRALSQKYSYPIGIIQDLQGPKLRVGTFAQGSVLLQNNETFILDLDPTPGDVTRVCLPHEEIFEALAPNQRLLLNDGAIALRVVEKSASRLVTRVEVGGKLSDRKGVNVPDCLLNLSALTPKDREDLAFGLKMDVDWVALSFVQRAQDVEEARSIIGTRAKIASKIEKPQAIDHLEAIAVASDALLVARGDLGVELPPEDVPPLQKRIIKVSRSLGKPVIVATQMLESMVSSPTPTRAEASDVAHAVYDGVDAVMLSAESAAGTYPQEAVTMMNRITEKVERDPLYRHYRTVERVDEHASSSDAITAAARQVTHSIEARAIVTLTLSGSTTLRAAKERPEALILALTPQEKVARQLTLAWGVFPEITKEIEGFPQMVTLTTEVLLKRNFAKRGDSVVITAGGSFMPNTGAKLFASGSTRLLRILTLGEPV
ncbi:MAG: pyruvate kinase [Candidatus Puniceispirillum sp.]|nr:pyruvate kinase [Candidatus Puniceispirillum sp.]